MFQFQQFKKYLEIIVIKQRSRKLYRVGKLNKYLILWELK